MSARATTFQDDERIEVEILSGPTSTGLCKVRDANGREFARHRDRLDPTNPEGHSVLGK